MNTTNTTIEYEALQFAIGSPSPALETNFNLPLIQQFMRTACCRKPRGVDYFSDASPIAMGGTPAIVFGPGNIAQAHTDNEWLDLDQLDKAVTIITQFLQMILPIYKT